MVVLPFMAKETVASGGTHAKPRGLASCASSVSVFLFAGRRGICSPMDSDPAARAAVRIGEGDGVVVVGGLEHIAYVCPAAESKNEQPTHLAHHCRGTDGGPKL